MAKDFKPHPHQWDIAAFILANSRCNVWADMGTGKTSAVLEALDFMREVLGEDPFPALVIAPLRVAREVWAPEAKKWRQFQHLKVARILGTREERVLATLSNADIYTINYDNLVWLTEHYGKAWPFKTVVADESTKLRGFRLRQGAKRAQALGRVAHTKVERFINLTGTPAPNGVENLWGQNWFVDAGVRLGRTYQAFHDRWFSTVHRKGQGERVTYELRPGAQTQIESAIGDVTITVRNPMGVDKPIFNVIEVELPVDARRQYKEMEKEFFAEINGKEIEALNAASKSIKCLQIASGAVYTDNLGNWIPVHDALLDALEDVFEEANGMPVLVAYQFKSDLARLMKRFPQGRHLDNKPGTVTDWNKGRIPYLFAHPASAGHGLNLQDGSNILAFFGVWWDLEQHDQIIERIGPMRQKQSGYDRSVYVHYLVAKGTLHTTAVLPRLADKRSVQDALRVAMEGLV